MALSDLAVFSEYAYDGMMEGLDYNVDLFNAASQGSIILRTNSHRGDFSEEAFWARIDGLVRRRNAYGTGAVAAVDLSMLTDVMVKVAAGTPPVNIPPSQFEWIRRNPAEGGALYGRQLGQDMLADMLNTGVMALVAALSADAELFIDTEATDGNNDYADLAFTDFNRAQALFGDRSSAITSWIMHSTPLYNLYGNALANGESLFTYGSINVRRDPFGRPFIVTDAPSLVEAADAGATPALPQTYYTAGLTVGAIVIDQNDDFTANIEESNGQENIQRTAQSEWSYNLGLKGYAWDKTNGGKSPNDAALGLSTNWDVVATSHKDRAGVLIRST